jgi:C1A family cysteine protease
MKVFISSTTFILLLMGCVFSFFACQNGNGEQPNRKKSNYSGPKPKTGCVTDKARYKEIETYEQLDATIKSNGIPTAYSIIQFAPERKTQGQLGACSAWANAYAARTISAAVATGQNPNELKYSPAFLYNQLTDCENGIFLGDALGFMKQKGCLYLKDYPYNGENCNQKATKTDYEAAKEHKISGYTRLSSSGAYYDVDLEAIKQNIAKNCPVIIAQNVPNSFFKSYGQDLFEPTNEEKQESKNTDKAPPHAMCIVGYDDNKYGGAFHVMNSWDKQWGTDGCIWVTYSDMNLFCGEAYVMHPDKRSKQVSADKFKVAFALQMFENNELGDFINLVQDRSNLTVFSTKTKMNEGDRFKILVENEKDCYIYIFGIDGSESYVLFPYEKTSAYFGVTGTRTFPKKKSFTIEGSNSYDYMTIVASKTELNPQAISDKISNSNGKMYSDRVNDALRRESLPFSKQNWSYADGAIMFEGDKQGKNAIYAVFQIQK